MSHTRQLLYVFVLSVACTLGPEPGVAFGKDDPVPGRVAATLIGRISDYVPRQGAVLSLHAIRSRDEYTTFQMAIADPQARARMLSAWLGGGEPTAQTIASGSGDFEFKGVGPGLHVLRYDDGAGWHNLAIVQVPLLGGDVRVRLSGRSKGPLLRGRMLVEGSPAAGHTLLLIEMAQAAHLGAVARIYGPTAVKEDGGFALVYPPPGEYMVLSIGGVSGEWLVRHSTLPPTGQLVLDVPPRSRVLRGRVTSRGGSQPMAGVALLFYTVQVVTGPRGEFTPDSILLVAATTDKTGRYSVRLPEHAMKALVVPRAGASSIQTLPVTGSEFDISIGPGGTLVLKTVRQEGGTPVGGVQVCVSSRGGRQPGSFRVGVADAQGVVRFEHLPPGPCEVWPCDEAWAAGQREGPSTGGPAQSIASVVEGQEATFDLPLVEASTLHCEVVDAAGDPAVGAWITARNMDWGASRPGARPSRVLRADASGRVAMTGFSPTARVSVAAAGVAGSLAPSKVVSLDEDASVRLTLAASRWLEVEVVADDDSELPDDAWIRWDGPMPDGGFVPSGSAFLVGGRARIGPLISDRLQIEAGGTGFFSAVKHMRSLPWSTSQNPVRITVTSEKNITGRVLLPAGLSVRDVELIRLDGGRFLNRRGDFIDLDESGRFKVGHLRNQTLKFEALAVRGDRIWIGEAAAVAGASDVEVELRVLHPEPGSGVWLVRVHDPQGKEVPNFVASLGRRSSGVGADPLRPYARMRHLHGRAVAWGTQEAKRVFFSVWSAHSGAGAPLAFSEVVVGPRSEAGGVVEIVLEPERVLRGHLVDATGRPMAHSDISIKRYLDEMKPHHLGLVEERGSATTDEHGDFIFRGLGRFRYLLSCYPPGGGTEALRQVGVDEDTLTWTLPTKAVARVRILDAGGKPVAGAFVKAREVAKGHHERRYWPDLGGGRYLVDSESDSEGMVTLKGLKREKTYQILVRPPEDREDLSGAALSSFDPKEVTELRLPPGRTIRGRVTTPDGAAVPSVSVLCDIGAGTLETTADPKDGSFVLRAVPMRDVTVWAQLVDPDQRGLVRQVATETREVALTVDPGRQIVARIQQWDLVKRRLSHGTGLDRGRSMLRGPAMRLTGRSNAGPFAAVGTPNDAGLVRFHGLPSDMQFALWGGTTRDGEYLYLPDLKPSNRLVEVGIRRGRTLKGRVQVPEGVVADRVVAKLRGAVVVGSIRGDHAFQIRGVPPGNVVVVLWGRREDEAPLEYDAEGTPTNRAAEGLFRGERKVVETSSISVRLEPMAEASGADRVAVKVLSILAEGRGPNAYKGRQGRINRLVELGVRAKPHLFRAVRGLGEPGRYDPRAGTAGAALAKLVTKDDLPQIASLLKRGCVAVASCLWELRSPDAMRALAAAIRAGHFGMEIASALGVQEPTAETTEAVREWLRRSSSRRSGVTHSIDPAAEYLAQIGDYESVPLLEAAIGRAPPGHQRSALACALAALGSSRSLKELVEILADEGTGSYVVQERRDAARTLKMVMEGEHFFGKRYFGADDIDEAAIKNEAASWMKRAEGRLHFDRKARRWFIEGDRPTEADLAKMQGAMEFESLVLEVSAPKEVKKGESFKATLTVRNTGSVAIKNVTVHIAVAERFSGAGKNSAQKTIKRLEAGGRATYEADFTVTSPGYYGVDGVAWDRERMVSANSFCVAVLPEPDGSYPVLQGAKWWAVATHSGALRVRMYAPPGIKAGKKARFLLEVLNESSFVIDDCAMQLFAPPTIRGADGAQRRTKIPSLTPWERYLTWVSLTPTVTGAQSFRVRVQGSGRRVSSSCKLEFEVGEG